MVQLQALRAFREVARSGSFTAAGRAVGLSTPSVSRLVNDLEADLGARLLVRTTRSIALTDAGRTFFERSAALLDELDDLCEETQSLHAAPRGRLRVSAPVAFGIERVAPLLPTFMSENPGIEVELDISTKNANLIDDNIDVALRVTGPDGMEESGLIARKLYSQKLIFAATPDYIETYGSPEHPERLEDHRVVKHISGTFGRSHILVHQGRRHEISMPDALVVTSPLALRHAVLSGHAMALMLDDIIKAELQNGRLIRILPEWESAELPIHIVYLHRAYVAGKIRAFVDYLVREVGNAQMRAS